MPSLTLNAWAISFTQCARIVVKYLPDNFTTGPYCPDTLSDLGGICDWDGENAGLYQLNGDFWKMVETQGYTFCDADGNINIADPAAGPTSSNNCLEAGEDTKAEQTALIPLVPVKAAAPTQLTTVAQVGLALTNISIFADAPSVLTTGNLPALDNCGGHIDPGGCTTGTRPPRTSRPASRRKASTPTVT
ncbi:hypothetical protein [Deinococcus sp. 6GRE01]|uniref:hypothetical protein n=1 Tax=Deinococcus sp. 6GRE01 TaxID=2745873 RepID=UPI001E442766|nr:hypothetical protein [Deinococcus sp. 6GRE01]